MKSYTDLKQSKQLAEILPIESADMCYRIVAYNPNDTHVYQPYCFVGTLESDISCWSLAALLEIIPEVLVERRLPDAWDCVSYAECQMTSANNFENLIDACVELICQLKEKNYL